MKIADSVRAAASAGPVQRDGRSRMPATKMCATAAEFTRKIAEWTTMPRQDFRYTCGAYPWPMSLLLGCMSIQNGDTI